MMSKMGEFMRAGERVQEGSVEGEGAEEVKVRKLEKKVEAERR